MIDRQGCVGWTAGGLTALGVVRSRQTANLC
jgi:hypothetical protein